MTGLGTKLRRDLWVARWQFLAISLVAALGVSMFQGTLVGQENQRASYDLSYRLTRFADLTLAMDGAPRAIVRELARLPDVVAIEGRLVVDLEVRQSMGRRTRVTGRLVSMPDGREPEVNRVRLLEGRGLAHPPRREVLLEAAFAREHGYRPGDSLWIVVREKPVRFRVAGLVATPEYIYPVQSTQFLLPTPETFGVMFTPLAEMEALLGMAGRVNEVVLLVSPGREWAVGRLAQARLRAYGPQEPMPRSEQPSNRLIQSDLEGNGPFLVVMPTLFLGSAALAVSLVLARWVQAQRAQVGFLRAAGFSSAAVLAHYLSMGLAIGAFGGVLGLALGYGLSLLIANLQTIYFVVPYVVRELRLEYGLAGFALALLACGIGALGPAVRAAFIPPAEAMRGPAPSHSRFLARIRLPLGAALPVRNLMRRPLRTLSTAASVACSVIMVIVAGGFSDSLREAMRVYLQEIQRYDLTAGLSPPGGTAMVHHVGRWPGVVWAEGTLDVPITVSHAGGKKETVLIGVQPGSRLRRLPSLSGRPIQPLPGTAMFTDQLAARLNVERGDRMHLAYIQNRRDRQLDARLQAGEIVRQPIGFPVYAHMDDVRRRFAAPLGMPPDAVTGLLLEVDPRYAAFVRTRLEREEGVALVQTRQELVTQIGQLTAYTETFVAIMMLFGAAMALAATYTATDSVLWERTRELATLRTLGFGMGFIARIVSLENLCVAALGAALGVLPGTMLSDYLLRASSTEGFTLRPAVSVTTITLAVAGPLVLTLLSQLPGLRRIARLDLASEIRVREQ